MNTPPSKAPPICNDREVGTDMLTTEQAARHLGGLPSPPSTKWRVYGTGPTFIKLGSAVRYRRRDLDAYTA